MACKRLRTARAATRETANWLWRSECLDKIHVEDKYTRGTYVIFGLIRLAWLMGDGNIVLVGGETAGEGLE
jgi:hypothetical protein